MYSLGDEKQFHKFGSSDGSDRRARLGREDKNPLKLNDKHLGTLVGGTSKL